MAKTGNTGTISFGVGGFTGHFTQIGAWEPEVDAIDDSHLLSSGFKTSVPDDLANPGETQVEVQFDPTATPFTLGQVGTITLTFPKVNPAHTAATLAGTGWIKKGGTPEMKNSQLMVQKLTIKWDGKTGPAYTKEGTTP